MSVATLVNTIPLLLILIRRLRFFMHFSACKQNDFINYDFII